MSEILNEWGNPDRNHPAVTKTELVIAIAMTAITEATNSLSLEDVRVLLEIVARNELNVLASDYLLARQHEAQKEAHTNGGL